MLKPQAGKIYRTYNRVVKLKYRLPKNMWSTYRWSGDWAYMGNHVSEDELLEEVVGNYVGAPA